MATLALGLMLGTASPAVAARPIVYDDGCTASFWLSHPQHWQEYRRTSRVSNAWSMKNLPHAEKRMTFAEALAVPAPRASASRILLRAAVTSYLNAAHEKLYYPYRRFRAPYNLKATITRAIASNNPAYMQRVTRDLDRANNGQCTL